MDQTKQTRNKEATMKIAIKTEGDIVMSNIDWTLNKPGDTSELCHYYCELERLQQKILAKWQEQVYGSETL